MNNEQFKNKLYELMEYKYKTEYTKMSKWLKNNGIYDIIKKKELQSILKKCKSFIFPKKIKPVDIKKPIKSKKFNEKFLEFYVEALIKDKDLALKIIKEIENLNRFYIIFDFYKILPEYYVNDCFGNDELIEFVNKLKRNIYK